MVDQGFFYRSDQFPFAKAGIPAIWISAGEDDLSGQRKYNGFWKTEYHTVKDEFDPNWELDALTQTIHATVMLLDRLSKTKSAPTWPIPGLPSWETSCTVL